MWTLINGIKFANQLEAALLNKGFHCALGGSVLHNGWSNKDLDIFVYPHRYKEEVAVDWRIAEVVIAQVGCVNMHPLGFKYDNKRVIHAEYNGKRIDFFFVL